MLHQAEADIIRDFQTQMAAALARNGLPEIHSVSVEVLAFFAQYDEKVFLLLGKNGDPNFLSLVQAEAAKVYRQILSKVGICSNPEYVIAYLISGLTGLLTYWHDTGRKIPLETLIMVSRSMAATGLLGIVDFHADILQMPL